METSKLKLDNEKEINDKKAFYMVDPRNHKVLFRPGGCSDYAKKRTAYFLRNKTSYFSSTYYDVQPICYHNEQKVLLLRLTKDYRTSDTDRAPPEVTFIKLDFKRKILIKPNIERANKGCIIGAIPYSEKNLKVINK